MPEFKVFKGDNNKVLKMFRRDNVALVFIILLAIVIGVLAAAVYMFYNDQQTTDKIQSGVFIKGINVSGLTKEEAIDLVTKELDGQMNENIELQYKNYTYYVEIEQIEAKFDIEASVEYAFNIAKTGDFWNDMQEYISVLMTNIEIEPVLVYDDKALTDYLKTIETYLPDQLVQHGYYLEDDKLIITNGINGAGIEIEAFRWRKIVDKENEITAEELAEMTGTINYEIICQFQKRVTILQHK